MSRGAGRSRDKAVSGVMRCEGCIESMGVRICKKTDELCFFFQAGDGIRDLVRSRGLGDVYKRQPSGSLETQIWTTR